MNDMTFCPPHRHAMRGTKQRRPADAATHPAQPAYALAATAPE